MRNLKKYKKPSETTIRCTDLNDKCSLINSLVVKTLCLLEISLFNHVKFMM